jgi:hypothetical protein
MGISVRELGGQGVLSCITLTVSDSYKAARKRPYKGIPMTAADEISSEGRLEEEYATSEITGLPGGGPHVRAVSVDDEDEKRRVARRKGPVLEACFWVAKKIDAVGPPAWSTLAFEWHYKRLKKRAEKDPVWTAIEARRHIEGSSSKRLLDEELTLADWETQRKIEAALTPEPAWYKAVRKGDDLSVAGVLGRTVAFVQRGRRGYAESDVWSLDHYLTGVLAGALSRLAATGHGWPGTEEFPTPDIWEEKLRAVAADLKGWQDGGSLELLNAWHELATDAASDDDVTQAAFVAMTKDDEERYAKAQAALVWVSEHLESLWD